MKLFSLTLLAFLAATPQWSSGATFSYRALHNGNYVIDMEGEIAPGDSNRFISLLAKEPHKFLGSPSISLKSPGGSVQEAIRISELLRDSGLAVVVESDQVCASSCFLIWAAADFRLSFVTSRIVMHRPYFLTDSVTVENFKEKSVATGKALSAMRHFLTEQNVSSTLIDKMMKLPSTEGYELTLDDRVGMGTLSPILEEKAIKHCRVSNSTFLTASNVKEAALCVGGILKELQLPYLVSKIGFDSAIKASAKRAAELAVRDGNAAIAAGNRLPPVEHEAIAYFSCAINALKMHAASSVTLAAADAALQRCEAYYEALILAWASNLDSTAGESSASLDLARAGAADVKATIRKRLLEITD